MGTAEERRLNQCSVLEKIDCLPWRRIVLLVCCVTSLSIVITEALPYQWFSGPQDFFAFYFGAKHVGTPMLYDYQAVVADQAAVTGASNYAVVLPYVRLPFYALLLRPITLLSYEHALIAWKLLSFCGLGAAALLADSSRKVGVLAVGISLASGQVLKYGQDTWIVLLLLCAFFRLLSKDREILAGICAGMAIAVKPNLFLPFLAAMGATGRHKLLLGVIASCVGAVALSTFVQGVQWPTQWLSLLAIEAAKPYTRWMPTIAGVFAPATGVAAMAPVAAALAAIGIGAWAGKRLPVDVASAVAILAGLMGAVHSGFYDLLLAIPGCIIIARRRNSGLPLLLLTPVIQFLSAGGALFFSLFSGAGTAFLGALFVVSAEITAITVPLCARPAPNGDGQGRLVAGVEP